MYSLSYTYGHPNPCKPININCPSSIATRHTWHSTTPHNTIAKLCRVQSCQECRQGKPASGVLGPLANWAISGWKCTTRTGGMVCMNQTTRGEIYGQADQDGCSLAVCRVCRVTAVGVARLNILCSAVQCTQVRVSLCTSTLQQK